MVSSRLQTQITLAIYTYLLTPWSRVLLDKLTGSAVSQEIPRIFGTRMFITVLTSARHLCLSWANSIQSPQLPPTSWRSVLILSSHLRLGLPNGLFPSGFPTKTLYLPSILTHILRNLVFNSVFLKGRNIRGDQNVRCCPCTNAEFMSLTGQIHTTIWLGVVHFFNVFLTVHHELTIH